MKIKINWWLVGTVAFLLILIGCFYYPFYQDVKQLQDSVLRYSFENGPLKPPLGSNEYVSVWGAFGDFVGGTLNPILGLISVILLFFTWKVTKDNLEFTKDEMEEIQKTQKQQQFNTVFFSLIEQLKKEKDIILDEKNIGLFKTEYCNHKNNFDHKGQNNSYLYEFIEVFKTIVEFVWNSKKFIETDLYVGILRVSLSMPLKQFLIIDVEDDEIFFKKCTELDVFKDVSYLGYDHNDLKQQTDFIFVKIVNIFARRSEFFRKNIYYNEIKNSNYLSRFLINDFKLFDRLFFLEDCYVQFEIFTSGQEYNIRAVLKYHDELKFHFLDNIPNDCNKILSDFRQPVGHFRFLKNGIKLYFVGNLPAQIFIPNGDLNLMHLTRNDAGIDLKVIF